MTQTFSQMPLSPAPPGAQVPTHEHFRREAEGDFALVPGLGIMVRDLGVGALSGGKVGLQVMRAVGAMDEAMSWVWHEHNLELQIGYIFKGWIDYEFEGFGRIRLEAGTVVVHLPRNRLRVLGRADDFEGIWIKSPLEDEVRLHIPDAESGTYKVVDAAQTLR